MKLAGIEAIIKLSEFDWLKYAGNIAGIKVPSG